ncbi:MAG: SgcJ/EcaC family oxidoreductase, partial [Planctomycetales bacterium]|nr:SgcJ/EcaC family oxidoreductase [Planctomycetales bacterium]
DDKKPAASNEPETTEEAKPSAVPTKYAADEQSIRQTHEMLVKAYSADDAKAVAALFTEEGEYVNSGGEVFQGREEIQNTLAAFTAEHAGCQVESEIDAIRFVSPSVAIVDGNTTVTHAEDAGPTHCKYHAVYAKADGKWQIACIRDQAVKHKMSHEDHLAELDFLNGEWVDEDALSIVSFTCRPVDNGKFLLREFTLNIGGIDLMSGSQRIGWDPLSGHLKTWIFDSEGGYAEGTWQRHGDGHWSVQATGVTSDGRIASGTSIYKIVNDHMMTWQSVDHEIDGVRMPDSPVFTLTHRAPSPEAPEAPEAEAKVGQK